MPRITNISECKPSYSTFNSNTALIESALSIYTFPFPGNFDSRFPPWTQNEKNKLEGWSQQPNASLYAAISTARIGAYEINVVTVPRSAIVDRALNDANLDAIYLSNVNTSRIAYTNNGEFPPIGTGGGPTGPTPLPFLIGATWNPYRLNNTGYTIPPLDYLQAKRQPKFGDFAEHGLVNRTATIRIIDTTGTCWYATSNYIITGVQKQDQARFVKTETSDGDYISVLGSSPRIFRITGELISATDYEYAKDWQWHWDRYLKGTATYDHDARFYLLYGGWILGGHLLNFQTAENSVSPYKDQLMFSVYVTDYTPLPILSTETEKMVTEAYTDGSLLPDIRHDGTFYKYPGLTLTEATAKAEEELNET